MQTCQSREDWPVVGGWKRGEGHGASRGREGEKEGQGQMRSVVGGGKCGGGQGASRGRKMLSFSRGQLHQLRSRSRLRDSYDPF